MYTVRLAYKKHTITLEYKKHLIRLAYKKDTIYQNHTIHKTSIYKNLSLNDHVNSLPFLINNLCKCEELDIICNRYSMPILKLLKGHKSCKKRLLFKWFKSELNTDSDE